MEDTFKDILMNSFTGRVNSSIGHTRWYNATRKLKKSNNVVRNELSDELSLVELSFGVFRGLVLTWTKAATCIKNHTKVMNAENGSDLSRFSAEFSNDDLR